MSVFRAVLLSILAALVAPIAGAAAATEETAHPAVSPPPTPQVWLIGPFGRVLGADPADPAGAAPGGQPLGTWVRRAPLRIEIDPSPSGQPSLEVTATLAAGTDGAEDLGRGLELEGPDRPGTGTIVAMLTDADGTTEHAWLVEVPDREPTEEAMLELTAPPVLLAAASGSVTGEPGHGCYVYHCVEAGLFPPPEALDALRVVPGETLSLELADGSALVGWTGTLYPVGQTPTEPLEASGTLAEPQAAVRLTGLEPPLPGEYQLEVRADFDRDRGWLWMAYRIIVE